MHETKPTFDVAVERTGILEKLAAFRCAIAGTAPLGLSIEGSDIDILCHAEHIESLEEVIWVHFRRQDGFSLRRWITLDRPLVAQFTAYGWPFQVFGSTTPVQDQVGWHLFQAELRLIELGGERFKSEVSTLRRIGMKTIPAIARLLRLEGDPFEALLTVAKLPNPELAALLLQSRRATDC